MKSRTNLRMTRQRETILEALRSVTTHPTADELFKMVREKLPHISLATVYRNLEVMIEERIVRKVSSGDREMHFDADTSKHYHMLCVECGRPFDLPFDTKVTLYDICPDADTYRSTDVNIEFEFVCNQCISNITNRADTASMAGEIDVSLAKDHPLGVAK